MELLNLLEIAEQVLLSVSNCPKCDGCKEIAQHYFVMRDAGDFDEKTSDEKLG